MDAFLGKLPIDMYCLASGSIWPEESKDGREVTTFSTKCVHNQSPFATKAIVYVPMHRPSGGEFLSHDEWSNAVAEMHEVMLSRASLTLPDNEAPFSRRNTWARYRHTFRIKYRIHANLQG